MGDRIYHILIIAWFLSINSFGQPQKLQKIDNELTTIYNKLQPAYYTENEVIAKNFKEKLLYYLHDSLTMIHTLDSLSTTIVITSSTNKKIKFYSWDAQGGGTWHSIYVVAQFVGNDGKICVKELNTGEEYESGEYTDSEIFEVYEIEMNKIKRYLTMGWGTHGGGDSHRIIQIFTIDNDQLVRCTSCFPFKGDYVLETPRAAANSLDLRFNPETNEITHYKLPSFEGGRYYGMPTKEIVTLRLKNGKFE